MKFSEKIIQARKARALTQEDLAEAVGVSRQAVSKWETGEAKPDLDKLMGICTVLDLSMDYLCLDKEPNIIDENKFAASVKNKHGLLLTICALVGVVAVALAALLIMGITVDKDDNTQSVATSPASSASTLPAPSASTLPDYSDILDKIQVADAKYENVSLRTWKISFVPNIQIPGMQVQIAKRNNKIDTTYYLDTTKSGAGYYIEFEAPDYAYDFDFIAVCRIGEYTVQFPLINVKSDDARVYVWKSLWKE